MTSFPAKIKSKCLRTSGPRRLSSTNRQEVLVEAEQIASLGVDGPMLRASSIKRKTPGRTCECMGMCVWTDGGRGGRGDRER